MLNQQTLEKLHALRLQGMAEAFRAQGEQKGITELSFEERFALLVDQQWTWRQNRALERRLAKAKLRHRASAGLRQSPGNITIQNDSISRWQFWGGFDRLASWSRGWGKVRMPSA